MQAPEMQPAGKTGIFFLIGMPGVGKTYWGRIWAAQQGWSFLDLDEQICHFTGVSIPEIFASVGEEGFRAIESHVLEVCIQGAGRLQTLFATGGGTPCHAENLERMQAAGCLILLKAKTQTLLRQLQEAQEPRPLLAELSAQSLEALARQREGVYQQATLQIEVEKLHKDTFAQILKACTNLRS